MLLLELGLPSFKTLMHNSVFNFECSILCCDNVCDNMLVSGVLACQPKDN